MNNDFVIWGLLLLALVAANAPFLSNRLYLIKQVEEGLKKSVEWFKEHKEEYEPRQTFVWLRGMFLDNIQKFAKGGLTG